MPQDPLREAAGPHSQDVPGRGLPLAAHEHRGLRRGVPEQGVPSRLLGRHRSACEQLFLDLRNVLGHGLLYEFEQLGAGLGRPSRSQSAPPSGRESPKAFPWARTGTGVPGSGEPARDGAQGPLLREGRLG